MTVNITTEAPSILNATIQKPVVFDFATAFLPEPVYTTENPLPLDDLNALRQTFTSRKAWLRHCKEFIPYLNRKEEKALIGDILDQKAIAACGTWHPGHYNPITFKDNSFKEKCKKKKCPNCGQDKKEKMISRLENLTGMPSLTVSKEEAEKITAKLTVDKYLRIPEADGTTTFIFKEDYENATPLMFSSIDSLAQNVIEEIPDEKRFSGSLGKTAPASSPPSPNQENEEEDTESVNLFSYEVKVTTRKVSFTPDSTLKNVHQIEEEVLKRFDINKLNDTSKENHQSVMFYLEKLHKTVCQENKVIYQFLYIEITTVNSFDVQWDSFKERLEKASL